MQRYFANKKENNEFILSSNDIHHIKNVMRMKDEDEIIVIFKKESYKCFIKKSSDVKIIIKEKIQNKNIDEKEIILIVPLLKEQKFDLVLQKATELGVSKIIPINVERSLIKIDALKELKKIERWNKICKEASEQCHRIDIPIITEIMNINDLEKLEGLKLVCSTIEDKLTIKKFLQNSEKYDKINLVIGPEGGLSIKEEQLLNKIGFTSISLGKRILRVETVPIFLLSILNYENME